MLLIMSSSIFIAMSLSVMMLTTPIFMGIWMLLTALMSTILISNFLKSWFALLIFLIYIGGMLVMFAYFSSLTPNQFLNTKFTFITFLMLMIMFSSTKIINHKYININNTIQMQEIYTNFLSYINLFSYNNLFLLLFLVMTLFFVLIAVVKITIMNMGPLRPFN
uniref:NADH-ubiquinone oxidoreductase chain 6 n=1 Tax=Gesiella jameensis TaxID=1960709 RepID=A0A8E7IW56_9ANNE|nr:NADH dehydrogenase subunit 6 [Gesiella jameensis]